jgi:hypothetical protein
MVKEVIGSEEKKEFSNSYLEYTGKPIILGNLKEAMGTKKVKLIDDKVELTLPSGEVIVIPQKHKFDRANQTIQELTGAISSESPLYKEFSQELLSGNPDPTVVYYPEAEDMVLYAPPKWHKTALILSNSLLIRDQKQEISWEEQRKIFDSLVIGVAGASVGKNAFMRIIDTIRPNWIKIADPKTYKDTNSNRTDLSYKNMGEKKAVVAAKQVHGNDPFTNISVYSEGLNDSNMEDFVGGNKIKHEPRLDYLVEETDDPIRKIESLKYARKNKIPFCMVTDIGSAYQVDFRDFKNKPNLPLMYGVRDEEIFAVQKMWNEDKRDASLLLKFGMKLIGDRWMEVPEFSDFVLGKNRGTTSRGIPQLGIAAHAGGSHLALTIAKHALGAEVPERFFVNLASRKIIEEGEIFSDHDR